MSRLEAAVQKGIVYGFAVGLGNDAQVAFRLLDVSPATNPTIRLHFRPQRITQHLFDPLALQVRASRPRTVLSKYPVVFIAPS